MTAEELFMFEKSRRHVRTFAKGIGKEISLTVAADTDMEGLTLLVTGDRFEAENRGRDMIVTPVHKYGTTLHAISLNIEAKQSIELALHPVDQVQAA